MKVYRSGALRWSGPALLAAMLVLGCSRAATTAGTPAKFNGLSGVLEADLRTPLDRAYAAAKAAMDELEFRVTDQAKDALHGTIHALQADGDNITVRLEHRSDEITHIAIEMGPLGKESTARAVIDSVESHL